MTDTYSEEITRRRIEAAETRADVAERERDAARAELAKVKRDIEWTMGQLKIADIIMHHELPITADGWLNLWQPDNEDSARLKWVNEHGRASLGSGSFCFAFDTPAGIENETLPEIYNIRHLIDVCRKHQP